MIKKLGRKFIIIAMCSVTAVLVLIIGCINAANYSNVIVSADRRLDIIAANGGSFPRTVIFSGEFGSKKYFQMSPEAPFDTRYFTALILDGTVLQVNTGMIAAVDTDTAVTITKELYQKNKTKGITGNYRYRAVDTDIGTLYIFVDCGRELDTYYSFITASLFASLTGLILVFILVFILSRIALKPAIAAEEKQKRFITDASHEIKTPLAVISASAEVIELENGESKWSESILSQTKRLTALTEKLVMLSRMDEESYKITKSDFLLSDAVLEMAESFEAPAIAANIEYLIDIQPDITLKGDENLIRQLVSLLLDNAVKYTPAGGKITISLKKTQKGAELKTINSVESIRTGNLNELFERFYREDESRSSKTGGHGIGLSVAKTIVSLHKGKITASSPDGKSIIFTALL